MTIEIGRICLKIAGRDAGKKAVIVDVLDNNYVLIDGETRRRKCNILHLEPLEQTVKLEKNSNHEEVSNSLKELGIEVRATKPKQKTERPRKKRKTPEQLRTQREEKKKEKESLKSEKKEEEKQKTIDGSLEEKAGLSEDKKHDKKEEKSKDPNTLEGTKSSK
jgi:large subunit ribosomal protein L14e